MARASRLPADAAQRRLRAYLDEIARADVSEYDGSTGRRKDPERGEPPDRVHRTQHCGHHLGRATRCDTAGAASGDAGQDQRTGGRLSPKPSLRCSSSRTYPLGRPTCAPAPGCKAPPSGTYVDPSLAAAALHAGPERLLDDLRTLGFLFESLVVRDLRIYAQAHEATVRHFRDSQSNEIDVIVDWGDGRWLAVEVKLGSMDAVDEAAETLHRVCAKVDPSTSGPPNPQGRDHRQRLRLRPPRRHRRTPDHRSHDLAALKRVVT